MLRQALFGFVLICSGVVQADVGLAGVSVERSQTVNHAFDPLPAGEPLAPELPLIRGPAIEANSLPAQPVAPWSPQRGAALPAGHDHLRLSSSAALVLAQGDGQLLYAKNPSMVMPIASITKLMTAMVVLDAALPLEELITVENADVDMLKGSHSRLQVGTTLSRREMLRLALMASENRAASALGRTYPGGLRAFVDAMNGKARALQMTDTRFQDSTGLNPGNVSTAQDLSRLANAGYHYGLIREFTTTESYQVAFKGRRYQRVLAFRNSNGLVRNHQWAIGLSKTGYINEAGRCLVMQATIATKPVIIVLLDSWGKLSRMADANRIKRYVETLEGGGRRRARLG